MSKLKSSDELHAKPYKINPAVAVLNDLQARIDTAAAEIRRLHVAMITIRDACEVPEYEIRVPRLVE